MLRGVYPEPLCAGIPRFARNDRRRARNDRRRIQHDRQSESVYELPSSECGPLRAFPQQDSLTKRIRMGDSKPGWLTRRARYIPARRRMLLAATAARVPAPPATGWLCAGQRAGGPKPPGGNHGGPVAQVWGKSREWRNRAGGDKGLPSVALGYRAARAWRMCHGLGAFAASAA